MQVGPFPWLGTPTVPPLKGCVIQTFPGPYTVGAQTFTPPELSDPVSATSMAALGAAWFLNYLPSSSIRTTIPFVPMIFSPSYKSAQNLLVASRYKVILGYNEPDNGPPQANTTVAQALSDWADFEAAADAIPGCRLGAPVMAVNSDTPGSWRYDFMNGIVPATGKPPRVDFVPIHFYTNQFTNPAASAATLRSIIVQVHAAYQKPVWITELGATKFTGSVPTQEYPTSTAETSAIIQAFMTTILAANLVVERVSWYPYVVPAGFPPGGAGNVANVGLADLTGALTAPGITFRDSGNVG